MCPDGKGGWTNTTGTGSKVTPPKHAGVQVAGNLGAIAQMLGKTWKLKVSVPKELSQKTVKRTLKGTPQEIAEALGLKLG